MNKSPRTAYLDFINNYMLIGTFAEHNGMTVDQAQRLIDNGKMIHEAELAAKPLKPIIALGEVCSPLAA